MNLFEELLLKDPEIRDKYHDYLTLIESIRCATKNLVYTDTPSHKIKLIEQVAYLDKLRVEKHEAILRKLGCCTPSARMGCKKCAHCIMRLMELHKEETQLLTPQK